MSKRFILTKLANIKRFIDTKLVIVSLLVSIKLYRLAKTNPQVYEYSMLNIWKK